MPESTIASSQGLWIWLLEFFWKNTVTRRRIKISITVKAVLFYFGSDRRVNKLKEDHTLISSLLCLVNNNRQDAARHREREERLWEEKGEIRAKATSTCGAFLKLSCYETDPKYRDGIFKLLISPGINFKKSIPPAYVAWRAGTTTLFLLGS
jgi:hypothetical protein